MAEEVLTVDVDNLLAGGVNIYVLSDLIKMVRAKFENGTTRFADAGGSGDKISATFTAKYGPMLAAALAFFEALGLLVTIEGNRITVSGKVNADADAGATSTAGGGGRKT